MSTEPPRKRQRLTADHLNPHLSQESGSPMFPVVNSLQYHAKLLTADVDGTPREIMVGLDSSVTVGRHRSCTFVIRDPAVSNNHFSVHAVRSASGGLFLSCQDTSTNGTYWNGNKILKNAIIVADGDVLQIPRGPTFHVRILNKLDTNIRLSQPYVDQSEYYNTAARVKYQRLGSYEITNQYLGDGSFGRVRLAFDPINFKQVACKTICIAPNSGHSATRANVQKEIDILRTIRHPNINRILKVFFEDNRSQIHIFLELCTGGDLLQFIEDRGLINDGESKYIGFQLTKALDYLHSRNIAHRDLKPENVLIEAPGSYPRVMLADFGFARGQSHERTRSICGTMSYVSPEVLRVLLESSQIKGGGYSGTALDCWSLGVCLYFMLSGSHPFDHHNQSSSMTSGFNFAHQRQISYISDTSSPAPQAPLHPSPSADSTSSEVIIQNRILSGPATFEWHGWRSNPDGRDIVARLLDVNPKTRATIREALTSPWILKELVALDQLYAKKIGGVRV